MARNAYRDALAAVRVPFDEARQRALSRGRELSAADRRRLPSRLRAELAGQEAALGRPTATVDEVRSAEQLLAQHEQTLAAALEYSAHRRALSQRRARTWRTVRRYVAIVAAVLGPVLTWWSLALAKRHAHNEQRCAQSYLCDEHGRCHPKLSAAVFARDPVWDGYLCEDDGCRENCRRFGRCERISGQCRAVDPHDCATSWRCREHGECTLHDGKCVVGTRKDCQRSRRCLVEGLCSVGRAACAAYLDADCFGSEACRHEGRCRARGGQCVAGVRHVQPCRAECEMFGRCSHVRGECVATYDSQCAASSDCADWGLCAAQDGHCVASHSAYCQRATACRLLDQCTARNGRCVRDNPVW